MEVLSQLEAERVLRFFTKRLTPMNAVTKILQHRIYYEAAAVKRDVDRLWRKERRRKEKLEDEIDLLGVVGGTCKKGGEF